MPAAHPSALSILNSSPLRELGQEALERLAPRAVRRQLGEGDELLTTGGKARALFILESGSLAVWVGVGDDANEVGSVGPGELVGEFSALSGGRHTATLVAREDTVVWAVDRSELLDPERPQLRERLHGIVRQRVLSLRAKTLVERVLGARGEVVAGVLARGRWHHVERDEVLFEQGEASDAWYLVIDGWIGLFERPSGQRAERLVRDIRRGDSVGERGLLLKSP